MHMHALSSAPTSSSPATSIAWPTPFGERLRGAVARWSAARRERLAYRRDLILLAGLGERELADFGAPAWLASDVQSYRDGAYFQGMF